MTWDEVKTEIRNMLLSRNLKKPRIRLNALDSLDRLFARYMPEVRRDPHTILQHDKSQVIKKLSPGKQNGKLNSAEKSVLNNVYQVVSAGGTSVTTSKPIESTKVQAEPIYSPEKLNKHFPFAQMLSELLEAEFGEKANYSFEVSKEWMTSVPNKRILEARWDEIASIYSLLVGERYTLDDRLSLAPDYKRRNVQRFDIWFSVPYNFAFEFDEKQHFNQFRAITLENLSKYHQLPFDFDHYVQLARSKQIKPGTSGFTKLRSNDPLFPPLLEGEAQDNRVRQRAFRDLLKDTTPLLMPGINPTIRVSYMITNGKRKDFIESDITAARRHILENNLLSSISLI